MAHSKTLQDKLARSLDLANTREAAAAKQAEEDLARVRNEYLAKVKPLKAKLGEAAPAPATPTSKGRCSKLSVSLFDSDLERLQAIRSYMATRGAILSASQAVKLALRTAALSPAMDKALDAIRAEDGRKW
jgi:hypothetical protein